MKRTIKVTRNPNSKLHLLDFENIPFGTVFTDHMFTADYVDGEWENIGIVPFGELSIHPGNLAWHYGQSIFEGMKASKDINGNPLLFRPELHARRLNASARRMCMPDFPEDLFIDALHELIGLEKEWIPPQEGSALYIRPLMFATDEAIGVKASKTYKFLIFTLPVGPYFSRPVRLKAEQKYVRAVQGGVGEAKTAGNYAASLYPTQIAKKEGFDEVIWMDAHEFKYIEEVGTMNIFFVIGNTVVTPSTDGSILKGITRNSVIEILRDEGYSVEERDVSIDEIIDSDQQGNLKEVFGTGTAAVIAPVELISYKNQVVSLNPDKYLVAPLAKEIINKLRSGVIEDKRSWIVPVRQREAILENS